MNIFSILAKYFWLICIIVTGANAIIFKQRSKHPIEQKPELAEGYTTLIRGFLFWGNLPWIVMGIGCTYGNIKSVIQYFNPTDGNPYILAFYGSVFLIWFLGTYWIFFRDGAEMLVQHPGLLNINLSSPLIVKIFW